MSLPHALLGLLAAAPATGYELAREFEREIGTYAWQAGHASIYPELAKLAARDLVQVVQEGARGSKTYDITEAGREELRKWLLQPGTGVVRNEQILRMFLIPVLDVADQRAMLTAIAENMAAEAVELRRVLEGAPKPDGRVRTQIGRLAGELGLRQYEGTRDWALKALAELDEPVDRPGR
jgi:PadR family transcriptional regulator, regulatory protein AphA